MILPIGAIVAPPYRHCTATTHHHDIRQILSEGVGSSFMPQIPVLNKKSPETKLNTFKISHICVSWPDMLYLYYVTWLSHLHSSLQYFNLTCVVSEEWLVHCCQDLDNDGNLKIPHSPISVFPQTCVSCISVCCLLRDPYKKILVFFSTFNTALVKLLISDSWLQFG